MRAPPPWRARWSLRTRLLAATTALLAAVSLVIGVVSVLALDAFLTARLDDQLTAAVDRSARGFDADDRWHLDLPDDPVVVDGDPTRLQQAVTNLLANARVHTPPGTTVAVSLATEEPPDAVHPRAHRSAVVRVTDDGPGIPADLRPVGFERFARGDASRSGATGSTGLGLAIVAAVATAHGGRVTLEDASPGHTELALRLALCQVRGNSPGATTPRRETL